MQYNQNKTHVYFHLLMTFTFLSDTHHHRHKRLIELAGQLLRYVDIAAILEAAAQPYVIVL